MKKRSKRRMNREFQLGPVIEARPPKLLVVDRKPEWPHQVKFGLGRDAGSPDVAGVPGDFRANQNDVH